jgi:hypothetical protein
MFSKKLNALIFPIKIIEHYLKIFLNMENITFSILKNIFAHFFWPRISYVQTKPYFILTFKTIFDLEDFYVVFAYSFLTS